MNTVEIDLAQQYLERVHQLAVRAESGVDVLVDLNITVQEATDLFQRSWNAAAIMQHFVEQLRFNADAVRSDSSKRADILNQAAAWAARAIGAPDA